MPNPTYKHIASIALIYLLLGPFSSQVAAIEIDPQKTYVLINTYSLPDYGPVDQFIFKNVETKKRFRVNVFGVVMREIEPGTYYLSSITSDMTSVLGNVKPLRISAPKGKAGTISIKDGTITYIGDWGGNVNISVRPRIYDWKVNYDLETIKKFGQKYPELKEHNLYIANDTGDVFQLEWSAIGE